MRARFVFSSLAAFVLASPAATQNIEYARLHQSVLERRLTNFPTTNAERKEKLYQLFELAGCAGEHLTEQKVKGSKLPNVICTLPGESGRVILIGAHFDTVPAGDGVVDNWTGAVLLPSLYESLKTIPRQHTFVFVGFTDEEKGLGQPWQRNPSSDTARRSETL